MGFSLKKTLKASEKFGKNLLFGRDGPDNPYSSVDFASLFAQDLEKPGAAYDYGGAYKNLMSMINAPSSVEAVQQDVEGEQMQNLLRDIGIETKNAYGSTMSDMADRGLVGAGQSSDIAANALGQVNAMGARTASGVHSDYALARLQRLFGKEQAAQTAQTGWVNMLAGMSESAKARNLQRMLGLTGTQAGAYSNAANLANTHTPGMIETVGQNFGSSYGKGLGEKSSGASYDEIAKMFAMGG